jgi:hypothetical protein
MDKKILSTLMFMVLLVVCGAAQAQSIDDIQVYDSNGAPASPYDGQVVTVEGVIIERGQYSSGSHYIMDDFGSGLNIYQSGSTVAIGDRVTATGSLGSYSGEIQMGTVSFNFLSADNAFFPEPMTVSQVVSDYENVGRFVSVVGTVTDKPNTSNFFISDGTSEMLVYIDSTTGIDISNLDVGDLYQVISPVTNYNSTIQLKPRFQVDLIEDPPATGELHIVAGSNGPIPCDGTTTLDFNYHPGVGEPGMKGYSIRVTAGESVVFSPSDITVHTLPPGEQAFFQVIEHGPNDITIDYVILGSDTQGIVAPGTLFTLAVHAQSEGQSVVAMPEVDLRDLDNASLTVDYSSQAPVLVDCGPPDMVGEVQMDSAHEQIGLSWIDPSDPGLMEILVYRAHWDDGGGNSAYPGYGQVVGNAVPPQFPTKNDYDLSPQWSLLSSVAAGVQQFTDPVTERGVYFYQLFGIDSAGNVSVPLEVSPYGKNYVLGDVALPYDGVVDVSDITLLGDSYGEHCGDQYFNGETDIGPTEDGNSTSIPVPDCYVGFEDLMIFSFTFGSNKWNGTVPMESGLPAFSWAEQSGGVWCLSLVEPNSGLKGLQLVLRGEGLMGASLERGSLLDQQSAPVFLEMAGSGHREIALACLGEGQGLQGAGELFKVILPNPDLTPQISLEARDLENATLEYELGVAQTGSLPRVFALGNNFPNPFNPSTTISFSVPESRNIRLSVYSLAGRLVRVLIDGEKPAGVHEVVWDGCDERGRSVASGVYFCRLEAGTFSAMEKMVLMK